MKARLSALGGVLAVAAVVVAIWSAQRLKKTEKAVKRIVEPVTLSIPELFPAESLLYVEARGWEESWDQVDSAKASFQETATFLALSRKWNENREAIPKELREPLEEIEKELQRAEERFGYRPTSREFIETYGRHTAAALVPVEGRAKPAALLVFRLPDGGAEGMLGSKLGSAGGVTPCNPAQRRGFPMFHENVKGLGTVTYGVGRGHLVVSDDPRPVEQTLDRLADAADPESPKKPSGTLLSDEILKKVASPAGAGAEFLFYFKRDQKFAGYEPSLQVLDEGLQHAFALAPNDAAVAFGASAPDPHSALSYRISISSPAPGSWETSLPAGLFQVELPGTASAQAIRSGNEPALRRFFNKPIWGEIDAFLSDPERVRRLGHEAFGGGPLLEDEAIKRLPNDARIVARALRKLIEQAAGSKPPDMVVAAKGFAMPDNVTIAEFAAGFDVDEMSAFLLSGALDEAEKRLPAWIKSEKRGTARLWWMPMEKAMAFAKKDAPEEVKSFVDAYMAAIEPSVVMAGRRIFVVTGIHLRDEIAALNGGGTGGPALAGDELFQKALKDVPAERTSLSFVRPAQKLEALTSLYRALAPKIRKAIPEREEDGRAVLDAAVKTTDAVLGWTREVRATVEWETTDEEYPGGSIVLLDEEFAKTVPAAALPNGLMRAPGILPEETWFLQDWRVVTAPVYEATRKVFVEALTGGEERLKKMGAASDDDKKLSDALVDGLFRNISGECGIAMAYQELTPEQEQSTGVQAEIDRTPAVILYGEFADPDRAWKSIKYGLERADKLVNPTPYKERYKKYQEHGGDAPWTGAFTSGALGSSPAMEFDLRVPIVEERRYVLGSLFVVRHDRLFFFTNSVWAARKVAELKTDGPGTLGARLVRIPNQAVPLMASELRLYRGSGWTQHWLRNVGMQVDKMVPLSTRALGPNPPVDRVRAHRWGWTKALNLLVDLWDEPGWEIRVTRRREGQIRVERKFLQEVPR